MCVMVYMCLHSYMQTHLNLMGSLGRKDLVNHEAHKNSVLEMAFHLDSGHSDETTHRMNLLRRLGDLQSRQPKKLAWDSQIQRIRNPTMG